MCAIYKYHLQVYHIGEGHLTKFPWLKCLRLRSAVPINSLTCRLDHVTEIGTCRLSAISWILFTEIRKTQLIDVFCTFDFKHVEMFIFSICSIPCSISWIFVLNPGSCFLLSFARIATNSLYQAPYPKVGGGSSRGDTEVRNHHHDLRFESLGSHD